MSNDTWVLHAVRPEKMIMFRKLRKAQCNHNKGYTKGVLWGSNSRPRSMLEWVAILLQEIFPSQGLNPSLQHCRRILYHLSYQGSPSIYIHMSNESGVEVARLESLVGVSRSCMGKPISQLFSRIQLLL